MLKYFKNKFSCFFCKIERLWNVKNILLNTTNNLLVILMNLVASLKQDGTCPSVKTKDVVITLLPN